MAIDEALRLCGEIDCDIPVSQESDLELVKTLVSDLPVELVKNPVSDLPVELVEMPVPYLPVGLVEMKEAWPAVLHSLCSTRYVDGEMRGRGGTTTIQEVDGENSPEMTLKALLNDQPGVRERKKIKDGEQRRPSPVEQAGSRKEKTASTNQPEMAEEMTRTDQIASPKRVDGGQNTPSPRLGADS